MSTNKNLFQIDYSVIGANKFQPRSKPNDTENTPTPPTNTNVYSIRLARLSKIENKSTRDTIKQKFQLKRTRDLIHTVCALYDNCLPDIGAQSVYDCVCSPKSFTICVLKDDLPDDLPPDENQNETQSLYDSSDNLETIENSNEYPTSVFSGLFSDNDTSDDSEDEQDNKIDFTSGLQSYLARCRDNKPSEPILNNLIAAATIQKTSTFQLPGQDEWVLDLQLMAVRKKYRGLNIGTYLINLCQNKNYVGQFDAIVTSSDLDAIKFYEKYGFNIDPILNSKYKFIGDIWTNTTKMCYIPPYCQLVDKHQAKLKEAFSLFVQKGGGVRPIDEVNEGDEVECGVDGDGERVESFDNLCVTELTNMENDFKRWQKLMFSAYQSQAQIFFKLKQEITNLKIKLSAKESIIDELKFQNDMLGKKNNLLKMKMGSSLDEPVDSVNVVSSSSEDSDLDKLIADLKVLSQKKTY